MPLKLTILSWLLFIYGCSYGQQAGLPESIKHYSYQTPRTNPGAFAYLYKNLPGSIDPICELIKCQLIHPLKARKMGLSVEEVLYWDIPKIVLHDFNNFSQLNKEQINALGIMAGYANDPDNNLSELKYVYQSNNDFRSARITCDYYWTSVTKSK